MTQAQTWIDILHDGEDTVPIGFERLRDGETVAKLIRDMQKDTT